MAGAHDFEIERLEAIIGNSTRAWLQSRFDGHAIGAAEPRAPESLMSRKNLRVLRRLSATSVQATQLFRLCAWAQLHATSASASVAEVLELDGVEREHLDHALAHARRTCDERVGLADGLRARITDSLSGKSAVHEGLRWLEGVGFDLSHVRVVDAIAGDQRPARTYLIDPPVRIAVVVSSEPTLASWREVWHELGHAAFASCHDPEQPWSMRDAPSPIVHEAFAELVAAQLEDAAALEELLGIDRPSADHVAAWRRGRRQHWREWLCDHVHDVTRPEGNARYVIADLLASRLRQQIGDQPHMLASTIRAAAQAGARYRWHGLLGQ